MQLTKPPRAAGRFGGLAGPRSRGALPARKVAFERALLRRVTEKMRGLLWLDLAPGEGYRVPPGHRRSTLSFKESRPCRE
jgi:hypothetical protein